MSEAFGVGLCGLSARDARLIEIVVARAPAARYRFTVADAATLGHCDIAVVDIQSPLSAEVLQVARAKNPRLVPVYISDHGLLGESRFRLSRRSLLLQILRTLEQVVDQELLSTKVQALPTRTVPAVPAQASVVTPLRESSVAFVTGGEAAVTERASEFPPLTALVVDDSLTVRRQLEAALDRAGVRAVSVENAEVAMGEMSKRGFDLIFLDVVMPGIDGYELCRKIKQNPYLRGTPVLMLTSRSSPFDRARGALAGCDTYLVKPITWQAFYEAVDRVLAKLFQNDRKLMAARGYRATPT
jgi:twitching motility two-component system response regulator PilG